MRSSQLSKEFKYLHFMSLLAIPVKLCHSQSRAFALSLLQCGTHIHYEYSLFQEGFFFFFFFWGGGGGGLMQHFP